VSRYQRPWWLFVNKSAGLITTVRADSSLHEQNFLIRGEPLVQGLAWLTWGPLAALLMVIILTGLAIGFNIKEQTALIRGLFIALYLGLPALGWVGATIITNTLSKKYLQAEREAEAQECLIRLQPAPGELFYRMNPPGREETLLYQDIREVRVDAAIGSRDGRTRLILDTRYGPVTLLNETLGSQPQKLDLAREIQQSLKNHTPTLEG
jgi:hypothetical protein